MSKRVGEVVFLLRMWERLNGKLDEVSDQKQFSYKIKSQWQKMFRWDENCQLYQNTRTKTAVYSIDYKQIHIAHNGTPWSFYGY